MAKEPPVCKKCEKQHWRFLDCSHGKTFKRVGYDTLQQESEYSPPRRNTTGYSSIFRETGYKQTHGRHRLHYEEE